MNDCYPVPLYNTTYCPLLPHHPTNASIWTIPTITLVLQMLAILYYLSMDASRTAIRIGASWFAVLIASSLTRMGLSVVVTHLVLWWTETLRAFVWYFAAAQGQRYTILVEITTVVIGLCVSALFFQTSITEDTIDCATTATYVMSLGDCNSVSVSRSVFSLN